jgi:ferredoxin
MRVAVDPAQCGCTGYCVRLLPEVFSLVDGETARAVAGDIPAHLIAAVREAAEVCPTNAIRIEE